MKKIRVHYQDVNGKTASYEYNAPADIDSHLAEIAVVMIRGGLFEYRERGSWAFSIPASRVLKIEPIQ